MSYSRIILSILLITLFLGIAGCDQKPKIKERATGKIQKEKKENPEKSHTVLNLHWNEKKMEIGGREILYKYDLGNPEEVALDENEITKQFGTYQNNTTSDTHYVTPEAESVLLQILSYPQLDRAMSVWGGILSLGHIHTGEMIGSVNILIQHG